jgi:PEP-CTERM motif-containing protein
MIRLIARIQVLAILAVFVMMSTTRAEATTINLTTAGSSGTLAGTTGGTAIFNQGAQLSGTGRFPAFVQVTSNNAVAAAYNTTVNSVNDNGSSDEFNHEVLFSSLQVLNLGGTNYYSFFLDINESNNATDKYLSLDKLTIITSPTANQSSTPLPSGTTRWNMSASDVIALNFDLEPGSGRADMEFLVLASAFAGTLPGDTVYLYSSFGALGVNPSGLPAGNYGTSDGFEEWAKGRSNAGPPPTIPEPTTLVLLGTGLMGLGLAARRKFSGK